jgi:threonine aldolase
MSLPGEFRSDNAAPVHPQVMAAIQAANSGSAGAYGNEPWTAAMHEWFKSQFGSDAEAFLVFNGTGANVTALRAMGRPYFGVICSEHAHINVDECGAPEALAGLKLIGLATPDGKLTSEQVSAAASHGQDNEHHVQPMMLSISQTTEYGTCYTMDELGELSQLKDEFSLSVHMDGSRIANAAAALGVSVRDIVTAGGVDILSFGLTKNGAMGVEAVVVMDADLFGLEVRFLRKQTAQLASKMRYLATQVTALGENDLWLDNARHANAMARRLANGIWGAPGITITQAVEANAVFAVLPPEMIADLQRNFRFYIWNERTSEVRWMTNWATSEADVDDLIAAVRDR